MGAIFLGDWWGESLSLYMHIEHQQEYLVVVVIFLAAVFNFFNPFFLPCPLTDFRIYPGNV